MLDVTFYDVTIPVSADDAPRAYAALCTALGTIDCEWITTTFTTTTDDGAASEHTATDVLWPTDL
jgi:hypothetical protein